MRERRTYQLARTPGFTPVPNKRIQAAVTAVLASLPPAMNPIAALQFAIDAVRRRLPPVPIARRHRAPRPSKSDKAKYRKAGDGAADICLAGA